MRPRKQRLATVCLLSGLALAVVGQLYFARRREYMWDGVFLYGLAGVLFFWAIQQAGLAPAHAGAPGGTAWQRAARWARAHPWRGGAAALSVGATLYAGARAAGDLSAAQGYQLLALWAAGVALYPAALADWRAAGSWLRALPRRLRGDGRDALAMALLFGVALATRLPALERIPFVLAGDEASMGLEAMAVQQGRLTNPFVTGWLSHPTLFFYMLAATLRWPGGAVVGLRVLPALAGALTVPALYLLARDLFGRRVAATSAGYLACYHYAVHYSRLGLNNIVDPLAAALACYLLIAGLTSLRGELFALAGVTLGLGQYFYTGARAMPLVVAAFLAVRAWREPGFWRAYRGRLSVMAGGFLVAGWPLFLFFARRPQEFMARLTQTGIVQSGWLAETSLATGQSQLSLLWQQVVKSALAFHFYPDPGVFYRPGMPLLDLASAIAFTFGLVYCLAHRRERGHALVLLWLGGVLALGGVLVENPPSSQRLVLTTVPVSVLVALGLNAAAEVAARVWRWRPISALAAVGLALAGLAAINLQFYFSTYTPSRAYAGYNTEVGYEMGAFLHTLGPGYRLYFFGAPRMYESFPTLGYLAPEVEREDVMEPLAAAPAVAPGRRPVFVFLPERLGELEPVEQAYPEGTRHEARQPTGALLFVAYEPHE